jgi:hypothetical protein
MAYSTGDLRREVHSCIAALLDAGVTVVRGWVEHEVLSKHPLPAMTDLDFNIMCRREQVSRAVREVLRDLKADAEDPTSVSGSGTLLLPGFKHLQTGYPFKGRDGELVIKPLAKMTRTEKLDRANQYRRMATGCQEHAEELERHARLAA